MALVNPNIAMSLRAPEFQPQNALADYATIQSIQSNERQGKVADMQFAKMQRDERAINTMMDAIVAKGGPSDPYTASEAMIKSGVAHFMDLGLKMQESIRNRDEDRAAMGLPPIPRSPANALAAPAVAPAVAPAAPNSMMSAAREPRPGFYNELVNMGQQNSSNISAAPAATPAPAPAAPAATPVANGDPAYEQKIIQAKTMMLSKNPAVAAAGRNQLEQLTKLHTVAPNGMILGGDLKPIFTAPAAPTQIATMIAERDKLIAAGVPLNDPRITAYNYKLAEGESQTAKLERELQDAIANGASPARIAQIRSDQQKLHPGLASPVIQGVDASGNTSLTRVPGAGGGPTGTFVLPNQFPTGTARIRIQSTLPTSLPPEVLTQAAQQFNFNGKIPNLGSGPQAEVNKIAILTEAAKTNPTDATRKELNKSYSSALTALAKQEQAVTSYVKTFDKNIDNALAVVDKIAKTNVPLINKWLLNPTQRGLTDDPDLKALNIYVTSVQSEFAKIQSGSMGNQVTADAAIKRAADSVSSADSPKAFVAALEAMKNESQSRISSFGETRGEITTQMRGNNPTPANPTPANTTPSRGFGKAVAVPN